MIFGVNNFQQSVTDILVEDMDGRAKIVGEVGFFCRSQGKLTINLKTGQNGINSCAVRVTVLVCVSDRLEVM